MRTLTGTLTAPDGSPLSGTLTLIAIHNVPGDVPRESAASVELDASGGYMLDVMEGYYSAHFKPQRGPAYVLGRCVIPAGEPISILELLGLEVVAPSEAQVILDAAMERINSAEHAVEEAEGYAQEANDARTATETLRGEVAADRQAVADDLLAATSARQAAEGAANTASQQVALATDQAVRAEDAAADARSIAESVGASRIFDTHADAVAALASLSDNQIIEVMEDETQGGVRTRYRVEDGALVFKLALDFANRSALSTLSGVTDPAAARANLELGSAATAAAESFEAAGAASQAITEHVNAANPHPQFVRRTELENGTQAVSSFSGGHYTGQASGNTLTISGTPTDELTGEPKFHVGRRCFVEGEARTITEVTTDGGNTVVTVDGSAVSAENVEIYLGIVEGAVPRPQQDRNAPFDLKSGAYTWWIRPAAAIYGDTLYVGGVDVTGNIKVGQVDADGKSTVTTLATFEDEGDDHNAPSILRMPNGHLLAMYTRHNQDSLIRYRISTRADDATAWEPEKSLSSSGPTTYTQTWVDSRERVHLFYRIATTKWAHRYSDDNGETWGEEKVFIDVGTGNYVYITTQPDPGSPDVLRMGIVGHPILSVDHNIYYGEIDLISGSVHAPAGAELTSLYSDSAAASPSEFELVFDASTEGDTNVRLFDLGGGAIPQLLFATFTDTENAVYREARRTEGGWQVSGPIVAAGQPIENPVGENYYFAGMSATADVDMLYLVRADNDNWRMEQYRRESGEWFLDQTLMDGDWRLQQKVFRPLTPYGASAEVPVIALRGYYQNFGMGHRNFRAAAVVTPAKEPTFAGVVLHDDTFGGNTIGEPVSGYNIVAQSDSITSSSLTAATEGFFGGVYARHQHIGISGAVIREVDGSNAQDVVMRADFSSDTGEAFGLFARWSGGGSERVQLRRLPVDGLLQIRERVEGVDHSTSIALPAGFTATTPCSMYLSVTGSFAVGRIYDTKGALIVEVVRTLIAAPYSGSFGFQIEVRNDPGDVSLDRFLVVAP